MRKCRKKCKHNERLYEPFINFNKAYSSVKREVLDNIFIAFGVPMKTG
jgi:hypothetical protein